VERNHVKRLLREAFDAAETRLEGGYDVVVVARPEARELAERDGLEGIGGALEELLDRAGLCQAGVSPPGRSRSDGGNRRAAGDPPRGRRAIGRG
jgi:RNase P protein component